MNGEWERGLMFEVYSLSLRNDEESSLINAALGTECFRYHQAPDRCRPVCLDS